MSGGKDEDKAKGRDLGDGRENAVEVHTPFLSVTVSHEAAFELLDAAVPETFDSEDHVAAHDVGGSGNVTQAMELEGAEVHQAAKFFLDGLAPIGGFRGGEGLGVRARDMDITKVKRGGNKEGTMKAGDVGFAEGERGKRRRRRGEKRVADSVVERLGQRGESRVHI